MPKCWVQNCSQVRSNDLYFSSSRRDNKQCANAELHLEATRPKAWPCPIRRPTSRSEFVGSMFVICSPKTDEASSVSQEGVLKKKEMEAVTDEASSVRPPSLMRFHCGTPASTNSPQYLCKLLKSGQI